jgi:hypothetical protein
MFSWKYSSGRKQVVAAYPVWMKNGHQEKGPAEKTMDFDY